MSRSGLQGHLLLVCSRNSRGESYLSKQSFRAPLHISKGFWNGDSLVVQVINPTAGLFARDETELLVSVEPHARLVLSAPSACRIHTMRPAEVATVRQTFTVARGARLEILPQLLIPQIGARYRQETRIDVAPGGELIFFDLIAPGRVASREAFQFRSLDFSLEIKYAGERAARERFCLTNKPPNLAAVRSVFPTAYCASGFVFSPRLELDHACWQAIRALHSRDVFVGTSPLCLGGFALKFLARDSEAIRQALKATRGLLGGMSAHARGQEVRPIVPMKLGE